MRIFDFDPADHRADYEAKGWVHIPRGVTAEFHELLLDYAQEELGEHMLEGFAIKGKKEQSLFEFPEGVEYPDELYDVIAELCGLDRAAMTLSERHIQAYKPATPRWRAFVETRSPRTAVILEALVSMAITSPGCAMSSALCTIRLSPGYTFTVQAGPTSRMCSPVRLRTSGTIV